MKMGGPVGQAISTAIMMGLVRFIMSTPPIKKYYEGKTYTEYVYTEAVVIIWVLLILVGGAMLLGC